jgi:hypothetical protein
MLFKKIELIIFCMVCVLFFGAFQPKAFYINPPLQKNKNSTLQLSFNYTATTPLLNPPYISGVIDDPTDPAATIGIVVDVKESDDPIGANNYTLSASSDNTLIVHNDQIIITKASGHAIVKIIPSGFGYSNITLTLTRGNDNATLVIYYASSNLADNPDNTFWHTGVSDASAVVSLDSDYMVIGDDEINSLLVYHRFQSGLPVATFNYADLLDLPDGDKEIDCEAGTRSLKNPEKTYWMGSMSNGGKNYKSKPNRDRLFQTDIQGTGTSTKFSFKGYYDDLRHQLIKWGNANGYKLSAAAGAGQTPKDTIGFNIEGIAFAPDSTTLYIGFRAPIVPISNRTKALIAPVQNFETWFNDGHPLGDPLIGAPIELNLGGRGIRDFIHLNDGSYVIIAGNSDEILNAALYTWSGKPTDEPVLVNTMDVYALKIESGLEIDSSGQFTGKLQVISDNGSNIFYNDDVSTKFLNPGFKKFRSDIVNLHQTGQ